MSKVTLFADVLLPLPLPGYYTYRVPFELNDRVATGKRVVVQFGKKKVYTALIRNIHQKPPQVQFPKYILSVLDDHPIVNERQFSFWEWMAGYYLCTPGEVMNMALPSGLKLASESLVILNPFFDPESAVLNEKEQLITEALLTQKKIPLHKISGLVEQQKIIPLINTMIEKGIIMTGEELEDRYKPKIETYVRLASAYQEQEEKMREVFDDLGKKAFRQLQLLMSFINLSRNYEESVTEVTRTRLLKSIGAGPEVLKALVAKGILEIYEREESRFGPSAAIADPESIQLSLHQQFAYDRIRTLFNEKEVVLLHGITSSGKTEIYIRMISEVLRAGKQVLYLLPEIALTSQIINRLRKYFGSEVGIYHSRHSENERTEVWHHVLKHNSMEGGSGTGQYQVILGARSALFLPYSNLGLVIVDEEHDTSYKQYDPAPRYNARDSAIFLAGLHSARTVLGSATPALESYFNAVNGKYGLVELTERYGGIQMPEILVADVKDETRKKTMRSHFTSLLLTHIEGALKNGEQVILFQNRRGFSLHLECETCNWIPMCRHCDISLTYHKAENRLKCHYCGYTAEIPSTCPECKGTRILMKGFGTEKVEEELSILYPDARIKRMDLDATRTKHAHQRIISEFEERKIDILVGTQMVTKGLDFDNVSVVGILNADNMINFPDFRSHERSYQLMAQVSGRAGRKFKRGTVIIQTHNTKHQIIRFVTDNDFHGMFNSLIEERRKFLYPPFLRLVLIKLKHADSNILNKAAAHLAYELRQELGKRVLGPEYPVVSKIKNLYIKNILVKLEKDHSLPAMKDKIVRHVQEFRKVLLHRSVRIIIDVDPL